MWRFLIFINTLLLVVIICQLGFKFLIGKGLHKTMSELSDAVAAIANDVTELQAAGQRVIDLLTQPNPDVAAAVEALRTADAGFDAIRDALNSADTTSTAEDELPPLPEPGGETPA